MISRDGINPNKVIYLAYAGVYPFEAAVSQLLTQHANHFIVSVNEKVRTKVSFNMQLLSFKV